MLKIGVFVCWCGSNIAATVDVDAVAEAMKSEPNVVYSTNYQYMCSDRGSEDDSGRDTRLSARRHSRMLLLAAYARGHFPQDCARTRASTPTWLK